MITVSDVSVSFSEKPLFKDVNLKFNKGNCYGITGANGAGKSTFLKLLSGELEKDSGEIFMTPGERMAVLKQDHFAFDEYSVKDTVMMGFPRLYEVSKARDEIYAKADFTEEDGIKSAELEAEFGELGGYEAENQIEQMLSAGVRPREPEHSGSGVFSGMSIVVTGTLPTLSRKQAEDLIRAHGGNAAGSVSKKTAFVVVGDDAGSKLVKAQSLGIETIDEAELLRRAGG